MESVEELRILVEKHTVRFETWPHYDIASGKRVMDGFDLELHGTHDHGHSRMTPGCDLCWSTHRDLRKIAEAVLPKEERPSDYEIPPFDDSLHADARGEMEVVLTIRIKHRHDYFAPVDDCEERCLHEMKSELAKLGVAGGGRSRGAR